MNTKPLLAALDDGYRHAPHEMLSFFLSALRLMWGLSPLQDTPASVRPRIIDAVGEYERLVTKEVPFADILGPLYMELRGKGSKQVLGQYFTPWPAAQMMARMTAGVPDNAPANRLIRVCDPACGSGVMLLAFLNTVLTDWGKHYIQRIAVFGCDLDPFCANMCAVQLLANCAVHDLVVGEVVILQGNSLGPWDDLSTVVHASAPGVISVDAQSPARLSGLAAAAKTHPDLVQLDLFKAA